MHITESDQTVQTPETKEEDRVNGNSGGGKDIVEMPENGSNNGNGTAAEPEKDSAEDDLDETASTSSSSSSSSVIHEDVLKRGTSSAGASASVSVPMASDSVLALTPASPRSITTASMSASGRTVL